MSQDKRLVPGAAAADPTYIGPTATIWFEKFDAMLLLLGLDPAPPFSLSISTICAIRFFVIPSPVRTCIHIREEGRRSNSFNKEALRVFCVDISNIHLGMFVYEANQPLMAIPKQYLGNVDFAFRSLPKIKSFHPAKALMPICRSAAIH